MAKVTDGIQRDIAEIKLENERVYPITHAEAVVVKEGPATGANKGVFLDEVLETIDSTLDTITDPNTGYGKRISDIEGKIPSQATSSNQLADKAFVNSSISTATATFRGTNITAADETAFLQWADALPEKDLNDYVFWKTTDSLGNTVFKRYKYAKATESASSLTWNYEYDLNNSSFTSDQWTAINSGITSSAVTKLSNYPQYQDIEQDIEDCYHTPADGFIPKVDLAAGIQASLDKADTAVQPAALGDYVSYSTQTGKTDAQKTQARTNIGAASTAVATTSANGLMSAADKVKLNNIPSDLADKADIVELHDYENSQTALPIGGKVYVYYGNPVEVKKSKKDGDNDSIFFIVDRDPENGDVNTITVLDFIQSGGEGGYVYNNKYTSIGNAPDYIKLACGVVTATDENDGLMSYQDKEKLDSFEIVVASSKYDPDYQVSGDPQADFNN